MSQPARALVPDTEWIRTLAKAEVHVHLEGCVPVETIGFDDPSVLGIEMDPETGAPKFSDLADFLDHLDRSCALVTDGAQLEIIAYALTERAAVDGVLHTDVIFNPAHWPAWRHDLGAFVSHLDAGFAAGQADFGVTAALCLSLKRTEPPSESVALVDWLLDARPERVVALSVDGNEAAAGRTGERFAPLFARARAAGLRTCAHAGESSGPDGVRDAIELLGVERIDHGVRAVEDSRLVAQLARAGVPLDICPTSNVRLGVAPSVDEHPIDALRRAGVRVSVNTDDPLLFGTTVASEYALCAQRFDWDRRVLVQIARTSIESCFAPPERVQELLALLDTAVTAP